MLLESPGRLATPGSPPRGAERAGWRWLAAALALTLLLWLGIAYAAFYEVVVPVPASVTITAALLGDVNSDGRVDREDLLLVSESLNTSPPANPAADINGDGVVDVIDLSIVGSNFGMGGEQ